MSKAPGFIFYPGDYLKDTQCLGQGAQVAYDRIMCEHIRTSEKQVNFIGVTPERLKFFIKRLDPDEAQQLMSMLEPVPGGYQIHWVADSVMKYNKFRESRSKNRLGKKNKQVNNTSNSSEKHMDIDIDNAIDIKGKEGSVREEKPRIFLVPQMVVTFLKYFPKYPVDQQTDFPACQEIAVKIGNAKGWPQESLNNGKMDLCLLEWDGLAEFASKDDWFKTRSISDLNKEYQRLNQKKNAGPKPNQADGRTTPHGPVNGLDPDKIKRTGFGDI